MGKIRLPYFRMQTRRAGKINFENRARLGAAAANGDRAMQAPDERADYEKSQAGAGF